MISDNFIIQIATVETAPNYNNLKMPPSPVRIDNVIVVKKGMKSGGSSIDIQCTDKTGKEYVIITTGAMLKAVSDMIERAEADKLQ